MHSTALVNFFKIINLFQNIRIRNNCISNVKVPISDSDFVKDPLYSMEHLHVRKLYNIVNYSAMFTYDITGCHTPIGEGKR